MTWVTNKASIVSVLTGLGYSEVDYILDIEAEAPKSKRDLVFTLTAPNLSVSELTSGGTIQIDIAVLKVGYFAKNNSEYDLRKDSFKSLLSSIKNVIGGYTEEPEFVRHPENNKYIIASATFTVGTNVC